MLRKFIFSIGATLFSLLFFVSDVAGQSTESSNKDEDIVTVIISAEKRPTSQKNTPVSVAHFTSKQLVHQKAETIEDVVRLVPNMSMVKAGKASSASALSVRGITPWMGGEPTVGFFIDDVYYAQPDLDLLDIESVDILRGPQSTLYGRNTEAGAVNIRTVAPESVDEYEIRAGYANYNTMFLQGIAGGGLNGSENWSWRSALKVGGTDGYFHSPADKNPRVDKDKNFSGRFQLRWHDPLTPWDVTATLYSRHQHGNNNSFAPLDSMRQHPGDVYSNYTGDIHNSIDSLILKANYALDNAQITSISALTKEVNNEANDVDFSPVDMMRLGVDIDYRRFSQELRINSLGDEKSVNWLAGLYFFNQQKDTKIAFAMPMANQTFVSYYDVDSINLAGFGQFSLPLMADVTATVGLRYDYERQRLNFLGGGGSKRDDVTFHTLLPKAALNWWLNGNVSLYTSVSRGYRAGGFNTKNISAGAPTFDPEYTWNYEAGAKTQWLDGRLGSNLTLFSIDLKNQQVELTNYPSTEIRNAGKSRSRGVEWDIHWRPVSSLTLSAGVGYSDTRFVEYKNTVYNSSGTLIGVNDYHDKHVPNTPELSWNVGVNYRFENGIFTRASVLGTGKTYYDLSNNHRQDSYQILNLRLGYEDAAWRFMLWADNVTDEVFYTRAFDMNGTRVGRMGVPRTYGVSVGYKW